MESLYLLILLIIVYCRRVISSGPCLQSNKKSLEDVCFECDFNHFRNFEALYKTILNGSVDCLPKTKNFLKLEIFITNKAASNGSVKNGSVYAPFDAVHEGLIFAHKAASESYYSEITIFFLGNAHYIFKNAFPNAGTRVPFFRKVNATIEMKPYACSGAYGMISGCFPLTAPIVYIYLKTNAFSLFATYQITIQNISFYGNDVTLSTSGSSNKCLNTVSLCCSEAAFSKLGNECYIQKNFLNRAMNDLSLEIGFLNIEGIHDSPTASVTSATLELIHCSFSSFYIAANYNSWVALISMENNYPTNLLLKDVRLFYSRFYQGIITSKSSPDSSVLQSPISSPFTNIHLVSVLIDAYNRLEIRDMGSTEVQCLFNIVDAKSFKVENCTLRNIIFSRLVQLLFNFNQTKEVQIENLIVNYSQNLLIMNAIQSTIIISFSIFDFINFNSPLIQCAQTALKLFSNSFLNVWAYNSKDSAVLISEGTFELDSGWFFNVFNIVFLISKAEQGVVTNTTFFSFHITTRATFEVINSPFLLSNATFFDVFYYLYWLSVRFDDQALQQMNVTLRELSLKKMAAVGQGGWNALVSWKYSTARSFCEIESVVIEATEIYYILDMTDVTYSRLTNLTLTNNTNSKILFALNPSRLELKNIFVKFHTVDYYLIVSYAPGINNYSLEIENIEMNNIYKTVEVELIWSDGYFVTLRNISLGSYSCSEDYNKSDQLMLFSDQVNLTIHHVSISLNNVSLQRIFSFLTVKNLTLFDCFFIYDNSNDTRPDLGVLSLLLSLASKNVSIFNVFAKNFKGSSEKNNLQISNGLMNFLSSDSFYLDQNNDSATLMNITLLNNGGWQRGVLAFLNIHFIKISAITFQGSFASYGGAFFILFSTSVEISDLILEKTLASSAGGAFYAESVVELNLRKIHILDSFSVKAGGLYLSKCDSLVINFLRIFNTSSYLRGGAVYLTQSKALISNSQILLSLSENEGGGLFFDRGELSLSNLTGTNLSARKGGALFILIAENITISEMSLNNCRALESGASLYIMDVNFMLVINFNVSGSGISPELSRNTVGNIYVANQKQVEIHFRNVICSNHVIELGSCIYFFSDSIITLTNLFASKIEGQILLFSSWRGANLTLTNLKIVDSKCLNLQYLAEFQNCLVSLKNLAFSGVTLKKDFLLFLKSNISADGLSVSELQSFDKLNTKYIILLDIFYCFLNFNNLSVLPNTAPFKPKTVFIDIDYSTVIINGSSINKCASGYLGCLVAKLSNMTISNSNITENSENIGGALFYRDSKGLIINTTFFGNTLSKEVLTATTSDLAYLSIGVDICSFFSRKRESLHSSLIVNNCLFIVDTSLFPPIFSENLTNNILVNSTFQAIIPPESPLMSAVVVKSGNLSVSGCDFSQIFSSRGAAIRLINPNPIFASFLVNDSTFRDLKANLGGAIYLSGFVQASIKACSFLRNNAVLDPSFISGIGGCLYFVCMICELSHLSVSDSRFERNRAQAFAPILFSQASFLSGIGANSFFSNVDSMNYTNGISAQPLRVSLSDGDADVHNLKIEIGSGIEFELFINLTDSFGQVLKFDSFSIARLSKSSQSSVKIDGASISFIRGEGTFKTSIKAKPDSYFNVILNVELNAHRYLADLIESNPLDNITFNLTLYSRPCIIGEIYIVSDMSCKRCEPGKYSIIDPMDEQNFNAKCLKCPENAECPGGSAILPKPGYWRAHADSTLISECLAESACLGSSAASGGQLSSEQAQKGFCLVHHSGRFCYKCEKGYGRLYSKGICVDCSASVLTFLKIILASIALILYILIQVKYTLKRGFKSYSGILIKLLINHYQKLSIISVLNLGWTTDVKDYFSFQEYFSFISEESISLDCFFQDFPFETLIRKVLLTISLVVLLFLFSCLFFIVTMSVKRCLKMKVSKQYLQERFTMSALAVIYVLFPENLRKIFSLLNCVELESTSLKKVVLQSPEIECWGSDHFLYFYTIVIPGFFFWAVIIPILFGLLLYVNKAQLRHLMKEKASPHLVIDVKEPGSGKLLKASSGIKSLANLPLPSEERKLSHGQTSTESDRALSPPNERNLIKGHSKFKGGGGYAHEGENGVMDSQILTQEKSKYLFETTRDREEKITINELDEIAEIVSHEDKKQEVIRSEKILLDDKDEVKSKDESFKTHFDDQRRHRHDEREIHLDVREERKLDEDEDNSKYYETSYGYGSPRHSMQKKKSARDSLPVEFFSIKSESVMMMGINQPSVVRVVQSELQQVVGYKRTLMRVSKFLYVGYHPDYFYWDIVILFQKTLFISVGNYTDIFPLESKGIFFMIILSIFIFIQKKLAPFETKSLNRLEKISLFANLLTTLFGLLLFTPNMRKGSIYIMVIIVISHSVFFFYWLYTFWHVLAVKKKMSLMMNSVRHSIRRLRLSSLKLSKKS